MTRILYFAAIASAMLASGCHAPQPDEVLISSPHYVTFHQVQLVCPAAPQIGCGSAAKPLLLELERQPGVKEAWLNRPGTIIAIVWQPATSARQRLDATQLAGGEVLSGATEDRARADFLSRTTNWHRAAEVDRLSEEEAEIIAARLVRRTQAKTPLPKDAANGSASPDRGHHQAAFSGPGN